ncbi:sensor histidine kinase [Nocardia bovistercoris]|uniref:histidine kinase n=1 Tax=Nocardia bovistercoris TaxID=2785916 RepID=A0A931I7B9_9NOCA|nr:histidine kinase [Nocardia bovistercoris]MBH0775112.1 two-component sensor histidine kinase [Nocardia bovistercoris]
MKRWAALSDTAQDVLIALFGFAVGAVLYASGLYPMSGGATRQPLWTRFAVLTLLCAVALWRRRRPVVALAAGLVPFGLDLALGATVPVWLLYSDLIYAAVLYGARARARAVLWICAAVSATLTVGIFVATGDWRNLALACACALAFVGTPIWWALQVRTHKEIAAAERHRAQAMSLVADLDRRAAIADERTTMARDLHDVIAGHLSAIALQSEAALGVLGRREDDPVSGIMGSIRANSVEALREMRTMIGLLRDDGDDEETAAPRGLDQLPILADAARAAGTVVRVRDSRGCAALPRAVDQAAYRIAQEALTNAMKHAPGRAVDLTVRADATSLLLSVRNPLPAPGHSRAESATGHRGLANMRQRATVLGGTLRAGRDRSDWEVRAELPLTDTGARADIARGLVRENREGR